MFMRIMVVVFLSFGSLSFGQASSSRPADAKVVLQIEAAKATFQPGEAIQLKVALQNESNSNIVIFSGPPGRIYKMAVTREDSSNVKVLSALVNESTSTVGVGRVGYSLLEKKDGKEEKEFDLTTYFDMAKPGKYKIVIIRYFRNEGETEESEEHKVTSNELTIFIGGTEK